ncbi:MAG: CopG family transcriptional regulator [Firmicutes bacterium]|nr:CopG family transcriptional regulator [Bacillota bacterium]
MRKEQSMHRMQFYIEPELRDELESLAKQRNVPMAELIREAIRSYVIRERPPGKKDPLFNIIGMFKSSDGPSDVAINHDKYIYRKDWE